MRFATGFAFFACVTACSSFGATDATDAGVADAGADVGTPPEPEPDGATASTLETGLLGRWRFDDGAGTVATNDVKTAPSGSITNGKWVEGKVGKALGFDGTTSTVMVPSSPVLDVTTAFTVAVWVNIAHLGTDTGQRFISRGVLDFKLSGAKPQIAIASDKYALSAYTMPENEWHHLAAVYAVNTAQIYVDGIVSTLAETTLQTETSIAAQTGPLWIGVREGESGFLNGALDDLRIWNRALSASEVQAVFAAR